MNMNEKLWCDLKTDKERSDWLLLGRGYETGIVSKSMQTDIAMAYHRLSLMSAKPSDVEVDAHLDAVLRASGSALRHYTMPKTLADMRIAMRSAMSALSQQERKEGGEE